MRGGKLVLCEIGVGPVPMAFICTVWSRPDIHCVAFEPLPSYYAEVAAAAAGRPNVELYNVAIGDEPGEMELIDEGTSSSLVGIASPSLQHKGVHEVTRHRVQVRRISDYDKGDIDYLRIDVEGSEWLCLKHLVSRPEQIVIEVYNDLGTYVNPYLPEINAWMRENHYRRVGVIDSDFVFVRP